VTATAHLDQILRLAIEATWVPLLKEGALCSRQWNDMMSRWMVILPKIVVDHHKGAVHPWFRLDAVNLADHELQ
jgi:hypothetical protein